MKKHIFHLVATFCIVLTSIISGCGANFGAVPGPIQLSPEAELTTHFDRVNAKFMAYANFPFEARIISLEPPGKPSSEVVTISTALYIRVTSIKSSDEKVIFQGMRDRSGWRKPIPIGMMLLRKVCQLPAGTYTIGVDFYNGFKYSLESQYVTREFHKGRHYVFSYDYTENKKFWGGSDKWKLKVIEK